MDGDPGNPASLVTNKVSTSANLDFTFGNVLQAGDRFSANFIDPTDNATYGCLYTYIGHYSDFYGVVGQASNGNYILFTDTNNIPTPSHIDNFTTGDFTLCFLAGTMISCPGGERAVETLAIGDPVLTADGRTVPVKWLGRQTIVRPFGIVESRRPVAIAAGALGDNVPIRDLRLTSDHALLIDGVLVHAGALVNGGTIRHLSNEELGPRFIVYHIEAENHEVILAEGAPAETFVDNATRRIYDNYQEYRSLYGDQPGAMEELPYPRAMSSRQVPPAIRAHIARRAAGSSRRLAKTG
jgi:hypothetical protein